jgi:hypothetical protein
VSSIFQRLTPNKLYQPFQFKPFFVHILKKRIAMIALIGGLFFFGILNFSSPDLSIFVEVCDVNFRTWRSIGSSRRLMTWLKNAIGWLSETEGEIDSIN